MIEDIYGSLISNLNVFDTVVVLILIYSMTQCFLKGFSLSLISFAKWILSTVITIILVPKLQPIVSDYVESDFVNSIGLGVAIFVFTLFSLILVGKGLGRAVTWTGVGSIDKTFGIFFGIPLIILFGSWFFNNIASVYAIASVLAVFTIIGYALTDNTA